MPQRKCASKRLRADKKRRLHNALIKNDLKKTVKKMDKLLAAKDFTEAEKCFKETASKLDKAAGKGIISKNAASRKISRISIKLSNSSKTNN